MMSKQDRSDDARDRELRRIRGDLKVSGVLRIGNDTIVEGNIVAPGGVILGDRVTVEGDVRTTGTIVMGMDCHVQGRINPPILPPANSGRQQVTSPGRSDIGERIGEGIQREATDELRFATLETSLTILLSLAQDGLKDEGPIETAVAWGLPPDALDDMVDGLEEFIAELFRGGDTERPWSNDEVCNILLKKVIGLIAPVSLEREADDRAVLRIGRPTEVTGAGDASAGWPRPLMAVIHLLGQKLHEDFRIEPLEPPENLRSDANPGRIIAMVRL